MTKLMPSGTSADPKFAKPAIELFLEPLTGALDVMKYPVMKLQYSKLGYQDGKSYSAPY